MLRHFEIIATADGSGSSLIDRETGLAIDGIRKIELVVEHGKATQITVTFLGDVVGSIEAEQLVEVKSPAG